MPAIILLQEMDEREDWDWDWGGEERLGEAAFATSAAAIAWASSVFASTLVA